MKSDVAAKQESKLVESGQNSPQAGNGGPKRLLRISRVLVPVDFSDCSRKALRYAVAFAKQFRAEIVVLYVVQPVVPVPEVGALDAELLLSRMREIGQTELSTLQETIDPEVRVTSELRVGRADQQIVAAADELHADLILLSTHGRTGLGRVLLGSVAEHVTRHAHCPVFIVREREHDFVAPVSETANPATGATSDSHAHISR